MERALAAEARPEVQEKWAHFRQHVHLPIARPDVDWMERPRTRADCVDGPRPCPWVSCEHHAMIEVDDETGHLHFPHGEVDVDELPYTCVLDESDRGGMTLEAVGALTGITRERVRQIEAIALRKIRNHTDRKHFDSAPDHEASGARRTLPAAGRP